MREYCCANCGLIWFDEKTRISSGVECPECGNDGTNKGEFKGLFYCDSFGWFYASEGVVTDLKAKGKGIHYHKDHPWYERNK